MQNKQIVGSNGTSQIVNYGVQTDGNFALKFFDANGVGVARFGQYADGSIALKVAKSGQEVDTATGDNLVFNSSQDVFKIIAKGTSSIPSFSIATTSGNGLVTIPHGQSFTPIVQVYVKASLLRWSDGSLITSNYVQLPVVVANSGHYFPCSDSSNRNLYISTIADATNIYVQATCPLTAAGVTVNSVPLTYFVLQETAA